MSSSRITNINGSTMLGIYGFERQILSDYVISSSQNYLEYNSVLGITASQGAVEELLSYLAEMEGYQIHSFYAGTLRITRLDKPLRVYRVGPIGKFWSLKPPCSPMQHIDHFAMPYSIYLKNLKEGQSIPISHPANKCVWAYDIPKDTVIATGNTAGVDSCHPTFRTFGAEFSYKYC